MVIQNARLYTVVQRIFSWQFFFKTLPCHYQCIIKATGGTELSDCLHM